MRQSEIYLNTSGVVPVDCAVSSSMPSLPGHARWIDVHRDLAPLAELLSMAFADRLDEEGWQTIRQLRQIARNRAAQRYYRRREVPGAPLYGFVWEVGGRLVGNVSLILLTTSPRQYLIANVAVDPMYRRLGIAQRLMRQALRYARQRQAQTLWLQVETFNQGAIRLYRALGFEEQEVVTLWRTPPRDQTPTVVAPARDVKSHARLATAAEWSQQQEWLAAVYPQHRAWHWPLPWPRALAPTWRGMLWRLLHPAAFQQWVARRKSRLVGVATWVQRPHAAFDEVLLACPPLLPPADLTALLMPLRQRTDRSLRVELPRGYLAQSLTAAGFLPARHLLWMRYAVR